MATKTTEKGANWGKLGGGSGKMHGFAPVGTQTPDRTSQEGHSGSRTGIEPQAGPSNVMGFSSGVSNKSYAGTQTPGQSSSQPTGGKDKFAKGGCSAP
jgi:hypothetical protein